MAERRGRARPIKRGGGAGGGARGCRGIKPRGPQRPAPVLTAGRARSAPGAGNRVRGSRPGPRASGRCGVLARRRDGARLLRLGGSMPGPVGWFGGSKREPGSCAWGGLSGSGPELRNGARSCAWGLDTRATEPVWGLWKGDRGLETESKCCVGGLNPGSLGEVQGSDSESCTVGPIWGLRNRVRALRFGVLIPGSLGWFGGSQRGNSAVFWGAGNQAHLVSVRAEKRRPSPAFLGSETETKSCILEW